MYCYANIVWHIKKKPGHLVNLGELVGPETYNLLCMALIPTYISEPALLIVNMISET